MRWALCWVLLSGVAIAPEAWAYCRTTTCTRKAKSDLCQFDETGCAITGAPLSWPDLEVDFTVFADGSPKRGISAMSAKSTLERAMSAWTNVDCEGAPPSIVLTDVRVLSDSEQETIAERLAQDAGVAQAGIRVLLFRDVAWPYQMRGHDIALTTTTYGVENGKIYGTEIELNSANHNLTVGDEDPDFDLLSVLTHESGHFFGLDDLGSPGTTMYGSYDGRGNLAPRTLSADDIEGMCAIYPPGRLAAEEERGCACRAGGGSSGGAGAALSTFGIVLFGLLARVGARRHTGPTAGRAFVTPTRRAILTHG